MAGAAENWFPGVTKEGIAVYSGFRRSPISGWTVAIGLPREFVDAPLRRARWIAFGGGAASLLLSLALAWWMARAIRRPVGALRVATKALGNGEPVGPLIGGITELDQVGEALRQGGYGGRELLVRVNGPATAWGRDDLRAAAGWPKSGAMAATMRVRFVRKERAQKLGR